ncbi:dioxygenase [Rhodococcus hoagii]|uniref:carotenoid oxygenase family protein n=1 Tax=Rhodococcus hoagii TaxID=43767 RepID=UPI001964CBE4|nr:carotenoid oxygenase family protein [Prescottella equi]MBM9838681.1 carotenoid oxygenase family protein [Prescottella equi]NKR65220.1 dioxygenase [Prescottella equi]NKR80570.1 dioxygenase [Prescottella equi]NKS99496.1 dioxygenase [Prescottella equi]
MHKKPYISHHYEPVPDEVTAHDLTVRGAIPPELNGRYFRNGHNPKPGSAPTHWFKGAGMIHGLRLRDGQAHWYRNRWVKTPALDNAPYLRADGTVDLTASVAGTHVIEHGGRILALQEANVPFEVSPELDTLGAFDFDGKLTTAMTAHPKIDPASGEMHFFAYSPFPPHVTYYVASPAGEIIRHQKVDSAGPSLMHDFAITQNHVVWLDMSVVFDPREQSGIPYRWSDKYAPRIGTMPRSGGAVTWYDVEPSAVLHVSNAYEDEAGRVVVEGPRFDRPAWESSWKWWVGAPGYPTSPVDGAVHYRYVLDPVEGGAREGLVDDLVTDFPTINDDFLGRRNRYSYAIAFPGSGHEGTAIVKYDNDTGGRTITATGEGSIPGEAVFVPREHAAAEDDGYLLSIVGNTVRDASELLILDARDIEAPPIAAVELPRRVPGGVHGSWIAD